MTVWLAALGVIGLVVRTPALAAEDDPAVAVEAPDVDPAELESLKATVGRYSARMKEFKDEARLAVDRQEAEERRQLTRAYEAVLGQLSDDDEALRATAIRRFEGFLSQYPEAEHSAHVMYRLAELYYDMSEERYLVQDAAFQAALEKLDAGGDLEEIPDEPVKDYKASIDLYMRIIERFPDYEYLPGCYYMLGYTHQEASAAQFDEAASLEWYQRIVDQHPDSIFAPVAHLRIGDHHFDYNELDTAIPHYRRVVELEGVEGSLYDDALYKLAWTRYKRNDFDQAMALLVKLLDWSEQVYEPRTGKPSATAPEAIEYMAISLADVGLDSGVQPIDVARSFFGRVGERTYEADIYKRLADVLEKQGNYDEAISVYAYIQDRWPYDPENPEFQNRLARLHVTKLPQDFESANAAIAELNTRYAEESPWFRANRNNPDALAVARGFIEESLAQVAINAHKVASSSGRSEDYAEAARLYGDYLRKFPFASDYYEIQWYHASVLLNAGDLDAAEREFAQLRKGGDHPYSEAALWQLRGVAYQRVIDAYGTVNVRPPDAPVKEEVELEVGGTRKVYALTPLHDGLIGTYDELFETDFQPTIAALEEASRTGETKEEQGAAAYALETVQAYADGLADNRAALEYQAAQVFFAYQDYDEARRRAIAVAERYPDDINACYSAFIDAESYKLDGDLASFRRKLAYYKGRGVCDEAEDVNIDDQVLAADFELAKQLSDAGKFIEAAEAYLKIYDDYPDSEYRPRALQNAANNYERGGKLQLNIQMLERYVASYPDDPLSRRFQLRLAGVYAQALDLDRAIAAYQGLYDRTKGEDYADAPVALFNAAFLRVGVGDFEGAARNYEEYGRAFPSAPDREQSVFLAGEQWERVGDKQAVAFYKRYLREFGDQKPDHAMEALYRIAVITEESGARPREVEAAWDAVTDGYTRLASTGELSRLGSNYAAHAEFRRLEKMLEEFRQIKFTNNDARNAELLIEVKQEELKALDARVKQLVSTYKDFEYSSGALLVGGQAFLAYGDMLYNAPVPPSLDEEEEMLYLEALDQYRIPVEDKGKARLQLVLDNGSKLKRWTRFQSEALETLATKFPAEFAPEKDEVRGTVSPGAMRRAGPMPIRTAEDEEGE